MELLNHEADNSGQIDLTSCMGQGVGFAARTGNMEHNEVHGTEYQLLKVTPKFVGVFWSMGYTQLGTIYFRMIKNTLFGGKDIFQRVTDFGGSLSSVDQKNINALWNFYCFCVNMLT